MQLHALSKELEMEPTKASRLLTKLGYGFSLPNELDGDMELHLRTVNDMLSRGFTINDAVGVVKRQIDGLDADDPEEPPPPPIRLSTIPGPKKKGRPKGSKNRNKPALPPTPWGPRAIKHFNAQFNLVPNTKWEAMNKAVEETVDKAPKGVPEDTKEGLRQLLLDICLNLVSQQDARSFEANKERCLSLLRRNNAGQPLTVN